MTLYNKKLSFDISASILFIPVPKAFSLDPPFYKKNAVTPRKRLNACSLEITAVF